MFKQIEIKKDFQQAPTRVASRVIVVISVATAMVSVLILSSSVLLQAFALLILSFVLSGFLNAAHECAHKNMFGSTVANRVAGFGWCVPLLINFSAFKKHHMIHHRYSGEDGDTDPPIEFESLTEYLRFVSAVSHFPRSISKIASVWLGKYPVYLQSDHERSKVFNDNVFLSIWLGLVVVLTFVAPLNMLVCYWLPTQIAMALIAFFALPEHYGCSFSKDLSISTRTITSNGFFRFFQWNANFHVEHHAQPGAPADSLPQLHEMYKEDLLYLESSYLNWHARLLKKLISRSGNVEC